MVRLLVQDEAQQQAAAFAFVASGAWVSHLVLAETIWVLDSVYGLGHKELVAAVDMLRNQQQLLLEDPQVVTAALSNFRDRPSLGFTDCLILEIARQAGHTPLGTFDKNLGKIDGAHKI